MHPGIELNFNGVGGSSSWVFSLRFFFLLDLEGPFYSYLVRFERTQQRSSRQQHGVVETILKVHSVVSPV
jgi:hypothetical protein